MCSSRKSSAFYGVALYEVITIEIATFFQALSSFITHN